MSSSCIEEVSVPDDNWYRIANERYLAVPV